MAKVATVGEVVEELTSLKARLGVWEDIYNFLKERPEGDDVESPVAIVMAEVDAIVGAVNKDISKMEGMDVEDGKGKPRKAPRKARGKGRRA